MFLAGIWFSPSFVRRGKGEVDKIYPTLTLCEGSQTLPLQKGGNDSRLQHAGMTKENEEDR